MIVERRDFLKIAALSLVAAAAGGVKEAGAGLFASPVKTNLLRLPGAVPEEIFTSRCIRCGRCVEVCPTGTLRRINQADTRMGLAVIDRYACMTWKEEGMLLCRTCYNVCPFKEKAIKLDQLRPVAIDEFCTGCGICTHGCPVTLENGKKAINIELVYAFRTRQDGL